jgi:Zn-finger nucleic acid-binding protein
MKTKRYKESYTKPIPKDSEVTLHVRYRIDRCPDCGNELVRQKEYDKYIENIDVSFVADRSNKTITQETIESGYCNHCKAVKSNRKIPKSPILF